ncbi:MAG: hypothetical protein OEL89_00040 [Candidatus Peregrinibacteria bacterium]|nr:hypothetical protein [Candidatus Peregrinibacteria bacterium]
MTLIPSQVQDIQTTVVSILSAGTWSLYGSQPKTYIESQKKHVKDAWIEILGTSGTIQYTINGTVILFDDTCTLRIYSPNRSNLNKIYADVLNIFSASNYSILIKRTKDVPLRNKYRKELTIQLKDI